MKTHLSKDRARTHSPFFGKTALVTGASRGIGKAVALDLAKEGARVALNFLDDREEARKTLEEIRGVSPDSFSIQADVSDSKAVHRMTARITRALGGIDLLINNAGITYDKTIGNMDIKHWDRVLGTNLTGTFNCCREVIPGMKERGFGRIINMSSVIGQTGGIGQAAYASSKSGIFGLTRTLALETAKYDITVNSIAPGFTATDMVLSLDQKIQERIVGKIPKSRLAKPSEISRLTLFLADPASGYITGQCFNINGGLHLG